MLKGFKDFIMRGNVVDLAVGIVIGAAFTTVITAFTNAFLKPLIQLIVRRRGRHGRRLQDPWRAVRLGGASSTPSSPS